MTGWDRSRHRWAAVLVLLLTAAACTESGAESGADSTDPSIRSETTEVQGGDAAEETGTGAGGDGTDTDDASGPDPEDGAEALRLLVTGLDDVPPDVMDFFNEATEERIEELAEATCDQLDPDLTVSELAAQTIVSRNSLTEDEREVLGLNEYRIAVGAMAGLYCPERLPVDAELLQVELELGDLDAYRETLPTFLPVDHPAIAFVESLTDGRLEELHLTACEATAGDQSVIEFGGSVLDHYNQELGDGERSQIEFTPYLEFVASLLGWFCSEQLTSSAVTG